MKLDFLRIEGLGKFNPHMLSLSNVASFNSLSTNFYPKYSEKGKLYIVNFSYLLELDSADLGAGYICIDNINDHQLQRKYDYPVMLLDGDAELSEVFKIVLEAVFALRHFDEGKSTLLDALASNQGIHSILNIAAQIINNPFYFVDASFRVVAWSTNIKVDDSLWNQTISNGFVDDQIIAALISSGIFEMIQSNPNATLLPIQGTDKQIINCALYIEDKLVGFLGLCNHIHPFSYDDIEIVDYVKKIISAQLNKSKFYHFTTGTMYEYFFIDLLKSPLRLDIIEWRKRLLNIKLGEKMIVFVVDCARADSKNKIKTRLVQNELGSIIQKAHSVIYQSNIVFIIDIQAANSLPNSLLNKMSTYLKKNKLKGGFSNVFSDISILKTYYCQACTAMFIASIRLVDGVLNFYRDYIVDYMLQICSEKESLINFSHPAIAILAEYDKKSGTKYLSSLKAYIDCLGNMSQAARILGIHYNTMKYRVKIIENIASISLENPATYVNLFISFRQNKGLEYNSDK